MRTTVTSHRLPCGFSENELIAEALGEAVSHTSLRVRTHLLGCNSCVALLEQYRFLRAQLTMLSHQEPALPGLPEARRRLDARLTNHARPRLVLDVWHSPVGDIRIGKTEKGIALVEFVRSDERKSPGDHLQEAFTIEHDSTAVADLKRKLQDYFDGKLQNLEWIVDDTLMRSDFQREVLRATTEVPYGTVVTYQSIADTIGQPKAVRAVAQALRFNPIPIHIPCHRVIGSDGALTGYAGNLTGIKKQILAIEGIPVVENVKGLAIAKQQMYVGWRQGRCFCLPRCPSLKDQSAGDRAFIPSRARAEAMGYVPCDVCHPEMNSL
jgi:methylated-DNA-[protein]-cysteine S-methyltransferase